MIRRFAHYTCAVAIGLLCSACAGLGTPTASQSTADATIDLGSYTRASTLFSYPNNCNVVVCYFDQTLEQTIAHWFDSALKRDGFNGQSNVREADGLYYIDVVLDAEADQADLDEFVSRYLQFLRHGDDAVELARDFYKESYHDDPRWLPNWRFILPHGLALTNNRSLEVMNFPPVSLLLKTRDYLDSNTTRRWNQMFARNGIPAKDFDLYGAILDIVPVAAPANEGYLLRRQKIYDGAFNDYAKPMLAMWTAVPDQPENSKPIMTLGSEMRTWFNDFYAAGIEHVLDVTEVQVTPDRKAPLMFTNHPSRIFYSDSYAQASAIMDQDAVANCWQAEMGLKPGSDPLEVKAQCTARWVDRTTEKCEMVWIQVCRFDEQRAQQACADPNSSSLVSDDGGDKWCTKYRKAVSPKAPS